MKELIKSHIAKLQVIDPGGAWTLYKRNFYLINALPHHMHSE
jgi:hypothetical protein